MKASSARLVVARTLVRHSLLDVARRIVRRPVSAQWLMTILALVVLPVVLLVTVQSLRTGQFYARSGVGGAVIASGAIFTGTIGAMAGVLQVPGLLRTRLSLSAGLATLPLSAGEIRFLSIVAPVLPPYLLGSLAILPALALCLGAAAPVSAVLAAFAVGLAIPLSSYALVLMLSLMLRVGHRASTLAGAATTLITGAVYVHAFAGLRTASGHAPLLDSSPVLWVLGLEGAVSWWLTTALWVLVLAALVVALSGVSRCEQARAQFRGSTSETRRDVTQSWPPAIRLQWWLLRILRRRSSMLSETLTFAALCALMTLLGVHLHGLGRLDDARTVLTWSALVSAMPLVALRGAMGPLPHLVSFGARLGELRLGVLVCGAIFHAVVLVPQLLIILPSSVGAGEALRYLVVAWLSFTVCVIVGSLLRGATELPTGKAVAVLLAIVGFVGLTRLGVASAGTGTTTLFLVVGGAALASTLAGTIRRNSLV